MSEEDINQVYGVYPEIKLVKDVALREKVAKVWLTAWRQSKYQRIEDSANSISLETSNDRPPPRLKPTLVDHTRAVVKIAMAVSHVVREVYGIHTDLDLLASAALVHDVDKMLMFEKRKGKYVMSDAAKKSPHGHIGAHLAQNEGMPAEISNIIISHTSQAPSPPRSLEGLIVMYSDYAITDIVRFVQNLKTLIETYKYG